MTTYTFYLGSVRTADVRGVAVTAGIVDYGSVINDGYITRSVDVIVIYLVTGDMLPGHKHPVIGRYTYINTYVHSRT